jgi:general secretion pathway protein K
MTPEIYLALLPHVCALPKSGTPINVNTASAAVLASLAEGMTVADGEALAQQRMQEPFDTTQEFRQTEQMAGRQASDGVISVNTEYFMVTGEIHVGTSRVTLYSLFFRNQTGDVQLLAHSKDAF